MKSVLISGATGLIGKNLVQKLNSKSWEVRILSRKQSENHFYWNPENSEIDQKAFKNLDAIIHLAGAPISKRWTNSYKKELYESRVNSAELLFETARKLNAPVQTFITASGVNYYGTQTTDIVYEETDPFTDDFLGRICFDLEQTAKKFENIGTRVCAVRTAAVLSPDGGMLKELIPLAKNLLLSPLGSGQQFLPWIHLEDMVNIYIHLLENENLSGAFNASATERITNKEFTFTLAESLDKKVFLPAVPKFVLKTVLGEMSSIILEGSAVSNLKIKDSGFEFQFEELKPALKDLLHKKTAEK